MNLKVVIGNFFKNILYYPKWRCVVCGKEIFEDEYFCDKCKSELPYIGENYCEHCGRQVKVRENYCSTCKGILTALDKIRSIYNYEKPITGLIKKAKYNGEKYIFEIFTEELKNIYFDNGFNVDFITFVPMTAKEQKRRGFNQSKILADNLSAVVNVPMYCEIIKVKETKHQAGLNRKERLKNLQSAFRVKNKKSIIGKSILVVDDVTTTGVTSETIAETLKKAGAVRVFLLTVCSVPPIDGY